MSIHTNSIKPVENNVIFPPVTCHWELRVQPAALELYFKDVMSGSVQYLILPWAILRDQPSVCIKAKMELTFKQWRPF
jgi:hypothetical protein